MPYQSKPNTITIFKNTRMREGKHDAQMSGTLNIEGREYYVNVWTRDQEGNVKLDKNQNPFMSGTIRPKEPSQRSDYSLPPDDLDLPY